ncbi:MAG: putative transporter, partial [Desulfovibrio sp.]|nr:putative transporter [Desulfovibrio sp.]
MQWFIELFTRHGVAQAVVALSLAVTLGLGIGLIRVKGIRLGVGGVLFSGLALAHCGMTVEPEILHFVREFGLILFVFTVGMQVGPGFVDSLRRRGLYLNLAAFLIVSLGAVGAAICYLLLGLPLPATIGLLSGAVTNTPSLAAASQAFSEILPQGTDAAVAEAGMAYAAAYPCGILGIILAMLLVRAVFRIKPEKELEYLRRLDAILHPPVRSQTYVVKNPNLTGMTLSRFFELYPSGVVLSRVQEPDTACFHAATADTVLEQDMLVHAVGLESQLEKLNILMGPPSDIDLREEIGPLLIRHLLVTKSQVAGKSVQALGLTPESGVTVTRISRAGVEFTAGPGVHLHYGDKLVCVGEAQDLERAAAMLGNSEKALDHPHVMPIFLGILLGVVLGSIPLSIPGLPSGVKLGLAGGPLLAAILLSRLNHFCGMVWYLPLGANLILREVGIALFLACVGLNAGAGFVETLTGGSGPTWVLAGACLTFFPLMITAVMVRVWLKYDYATICGLLAGSMTDPPALAFCVQMLGSDAASSVYATV